MEAKVVTTTNYDRSGCGDVLVVLAVDLPYIVVRYENEYKNSRIVVQKDTRRTNFMELSDEYVLAMHPYLSDIINEKRKKEKRRIHEFSAFLLTYPTHNL